MLCSPRPLRFSILIALILIATIATAEEAPGTLLWKHQVGEQIWTPLTHDQGSLYFGCDDGSVFALDTSSRELRWSFQSEGRVRSAVSCVDGKALFASDDGNLYALDSATGKELWRFDLGSGEMERILPDPGPPYEYDYLHSSPVVDDGMVYIGSADSNLYAIELETGRESWRFKTQNKIRATPTVNEGVVYIGSWDGHLYAVDANTGAMRWKYYTAGNIQSSAAVAAGKVIVGCRGAKVQAMNASTGELEWVRAHTDGSWVESSPVVREGVVYIGSSDALKLFALDLETGEESWEFKTNGWSWGTPVVTDDVVYIGGISAFPYYFDGVTLEAGFYAVDRHSGELSWKMAPESIEGYITGGVFASAALADGVVYVAGLDGGIYALRE